MGRIKETAIGANLARRLDAKSETQAEAPPPPPQAAPAAPAEPQAAPKKVRARDGMHYVGCHIPEDMFERLRTVAFETRKEKQVLMREALDIVLKKYGQ